jgi:hypothetical protein
MYSVYARPDDAAPAVAMTAGGNRSAMLRGVATTPVLL